MLRKKAKGKADEEEKKPKGAGSEEEGAAEEGGKPGEEEPEGAPEGSEEEEEPGEEEEGGKPEEGGTPPEPQGIDWKALSKKWEERAKANQAAAEQLEAERKRANDAESALSDYRANEEHADWARKASEATGVPAEVLRGSTEEELMEHAKALAPYFKKPATPKVDMGRPHGQQAAEDGRSKLAKMLFNDR